VRPARRRTTARALWLLTWAALLSACATAPPGPAPDYPAWAERREALAALEDWSLTGRLALRTEEESWSATLQWRQRGDDYRIRLTGPLGQGAVQIAGGPAGVTLTTATGERARAPDPEALLARTTGWRLPVSGLRHWLLGRDDPAQPVRSLEADGAGRPVRIAQGAWRIRYGGWHPEAPLDLPARLELEAPGVEARLAVTRWSIP
jgi:outer membrane lipoprotein LolB